MKLATVEVTTRIVLRFPDDMHIDDVMAGHLETYFRASEPVLVDEYEYISHRQTYWINKL